MSKLPRISGRECIRAFEKIGFRVVRQKGSHIVVRRDNPLAQTVVPDHKELAPGTLRRIIRDAGLSVEEFLALL
ncbi:MAG: type II toxin-antitoxin system HicA family toxin [Chloroflexi bacterium]|nr:type II toxin-antitoxin system HicA family toxin [Chloroflexota bacterium]